MSSAYSVNDNTCKIILKKRWLVIVKKFKGGLSEKFGSRSIKYVISLEEQGIE